MEHIFILPLSSLRSAVRKKYHNLQSVNSHTILIYILDYFYSQSNLSIYIFNTNTLRLKLKSVIKIGVQSFKRRRKE